MAYKELFSMGGWRFSIKLEERNPGEIKRGGLSEDQINNLLGLAPVPYFDPSSGEFSIDLSECCIPEDFDQYEGDIKKAELMAFLLNQFFESPTLVEKRRPVKTRTTPRRSLERWFTDMRFLATDFDESCALNESGLYKV